MNCEGDFKGGHWRNISELQAGEFMSEQNRKYIMKEVGKLLFGIWRIKGQSEHEYGPQYPITKKLSNMHADAQALLQEKQG